MGTAASSRKNNGDEVFSPRVKMFKKGEAIVLDSTALKEVGFGTVRYRHETVVDETTGEDLQLQKGYFYHPNLTDYSEVAKAEKENICNFVKVTKPSNTAYSKQVLYVSGIGFDGKGNALPPSLIKEKKFGHKYFTMALTKQNTLPLLPSNEENITENFIELTLVADSTIRDVKCKISERENCPVAAIHVKTGTEGELSDVSSMKELFSETEEIKVKLTEIK